LEFELLFQFLFGIVGALVIIYLRVYETLPRMSGATLILDRTQEADQLKEKWHSLAIESETVKDTDVLEKLRDDYQLRESEIRKEVRDLKFRQWILTAGLYVILGGFFALIVFPLISDEKILLDGMIQPVEALKCMGIGFTWTTYISLLESKNPEKEAREIREKILQDVETKTEEVTKHYEKDIKDITGEFEEYRKNAKELIDKYKALLGIK
jgi:hypothetical protein